MRARIFIVALLPFVLALALQQKSYAQLSNREFEPIVLKGADFPEFSGVQVSQLLLFSYTGETAKPWVRIPFQIDEVASGSYFEEDDGLLDDDDEIVFMAKDGGLSAFESWIDDESSKAFSRYEISLVEAKVEQTGFVYLYRSTLLPVQWEGEDYVQYQPSVSGNIGEDSVTSGAYTIGHDMKGFPSDLIISADIGGNGEDIFDALKIRAIVGGAKVFGVPVSITLTEKLIQIEPDSLDGVKAIDGNVRVIREVDASFVLQIPNIVDVFEDFTTPPIYYYSNSMSFALEIPDVSSINEDYYLTGGRLSMDLTPSASGMMFTSPKNSVPSTVNGQADETIETSIDDLLPLGNWASIRGTQGALVHFFPIATTVGDGRNLFFVDESPTSGQSETGDGDSFGDTGIEITGNVEPPFLLSYKGYFMRPDVDEKIAETLAFNEANALDVSLFAQTFEDVTSVEQDNEVAPSTFHLAQNYPNPFNPTTKINYTIPTSVKGAVRIKLGVYNLLGQLVRTVVDEEMNAGTYEAIWNGLDDAGRAVTSGVYIYRLSSGKFIENKKMILIK